MGNRRGQLRTHFVSTVNEPKAVCGVVVNDNMPLIFWDMRLWNSEYAQSNRCCNCVAAVRKYEFAMEAGL